MQEPICVVGDALHGEAKRWDEGCKRDEARNSFVIPQVARILAAFDAKRVIDVGAGTGYVARAVDARLPQRVDWTLVDTSESRMALAEQLRPDSMQQRTVLCDAAQYSSAHIEPFDAALVIFTLLEEIDTLECITSIAHHLINGGIMVVALPDTWADVWQEAQKNPSAAKDFLAGSVHLSKIDKFTRAPYPFRALRLELVIELALKAGFHLVEFLRGGGSKTTFVLVFRQARSHQHG